MSTGHDVPDPTIALGPAIGELSGRVSGPVLLRGDEAYDEERTGYQTFGVHRPALVVGATRAEDVRAAVEFAAAHDLPVAVQATGHSPAPAADGGLLVTTRRMTDVTIDPEARTARFAAGVTSRQLIEAATPYGLAPLNGSAPGVGAVSYMLGGGLGLMARRHGYAADHIRAIDVVTADGQLRHVTGESDPDLFWALRGGRGSLGVVTGLEVDLVPVERLYGGGLYFDGSLAEHVVNAYLRWTGTVPDEMTSSIALVPLPDIPALPPPLRGRYVVHVRVAYLGDAETGERLVAPLRALGPALADSVRELPYAESGSIHNDPVQPAPYIGTNAMTRDLDEGLVKTVLELTGPQAPVTCIVEIRHLGGALAQPPAVANAVGNRDARYMLAVLNRVAPDNLDATRAAHARLIEALEPVTTGRSLNFLYGENATAEQVRMAYDPKDYLRLREIKAVYDPANIFRLTHNIPPINVQSIR
ncbi:FAD-binding oxidoreductase [Streptomyces sp. APSN-46.1]|uniref:FAD-binding oxidoreductase n=1 Tax=Streptomyces sp. APSN-46.1 TaxID=2929049 RepID=UPI001FB3A862|nr:FAD-binding oxidoreductase [Streptomyces sp. APSN-46.1]MCJ1680429.1 FAD-binding oxidoreductase [Streptomyces sp. APSN-46.1]